MNETTDEPTNVDDEDQPEQSAIRTTGPEWWAFITECLSIAF